MALRKETRKKSKSGVDVESLKDNHLIKLFLQGCEPAFVELMRRYKAKVKQLAFRITRSVEDAEDVAQDVFMTVYLKLKDFEGKSAFSSWLYRIAFNASLMKLRKEKSRNLSSAIDQVEEIKIQVEQSPDFNSESAHQLTELREMILASIDKLPAQYKQIVVLGDLQNLTHDEISGITGLTISAIKSRLHRARLMLKKKLKHALREKPQPMHRYVVC